MAQRAACRQSPEHSEREDDTISRKGTERCTRRCLMIVRVTPDPSKAQSVHENGVNGKCGCVPKA